MVDNPGKYGATQVRGHRGSARSELGREPLEVSNDASMLPSLSLESRGVEALHQNFLTIKMVDCIAHQLLDEPCLRLKHPLIDALEGRSVQLEVQVDGVAKEDTMVRIYGIDARVEQYGVKITLASGSEQRPSYPCSLVYHFPATSSVGRRASLTTILPSKGSPTLPQIPTNSFRREATTRVVPSESLPSRSRTALRPSSSRPASARFHTRSLGRLAIDRAMQRRWTRAAGRSSARGSRGVS